MTITVRPGSGVSAAKRRARLLATREARRSANSIRGLHHHAVRTDDMEATRRFYEDVLGTPLVAALKENAAGVTGENIPFLLCLFELGDGSKLAFFELAPRTGEPAGKLPRNGIDHHVAFAVPDFGEVLRLKTRFDELNYLTCGINHGSNYSLYVRDPNGMLLELVVDAPDELEQVEGAAEAAHDVLAAWKNGDYVSHDATGPTMDFPLSTSSPEEIRLVIGEIGKEESVEAA